jgi:sulfate adenylyltransferase subunit 1
MEMLRFITAGNVDNGKSTLIGRLLYDSNSIPADILESLARQGQKADLSLITDGLRAERENKITIDVAYKYFTTAKRKFIIADTPGHFEYTGNMFTGASTAQLAIIVVDAQQGVMEQTRRHASIISLMRMPAVIFCINKMDLVDYSEKKFSELTSDLKKLFFPEGTEIHFIPVSAAMGDNVVHLSKQMPWYKGKSLLSYLEETPAEKNGSEIPARAQVQLIIENDSQKGIAAKIRSGYFGEGDKIVILPEGKECIITSIETAGRKSARAGNGEAVTFYVSDPVAIKRGGMIVKPGDMPHIAAEMEVTLCWMNADELHENSRWILQHYSCSVPVEIRAVREKLNPGTSKFQKSEGKMCMHDVARVHIVCDKPLVFDKYAENRFTGGFILADERTGNTVGAGIF